MQSLYETQFFVAADDGDVTATYRRQQIDVNEIASPIAAISRKTNAQPNGQQRRIYTSTPKKSFEKQSRQSNDVFVGICYSVRSTLKQFICVGGAATVKEQVAAFDVRLKLIILLFGALTIGKHIINLTMSHINGDSVQQLISYTQAQLNVAANWSEEHQLRSKLSPVLCGLMVAIFSYAMVYMDSAVPGVNPPTPFSPTSKRNLRCERRVSLHLNYLCALGAGFMVTFLMYVDL